MSNGASGLEVLAQERKNLLMAEVAGLLHDIGKFCDVHISTYADNRPSGSPRWPRNAYKVVVDDPASLIKFDTSCPLASSLSKLSSSASPKMADLLSAEAKDALAQTVVSIHGTGYSLAELIMLSRPGLAHCQNLTDCLGKDGWLVATLAVCHGEAHFDKQDPVGGKQTYSDIRASTAFGFEGRRIRPDQSPASLTYYLNRLPLGDVGVYEKIRPALVESLPLGLGDTRRPVNEVSLWDWSSSVAALYKAAVAGSLLTGVKPDARGWLDRVNHVLDHDFQWGLLCVALGGLTFLERAPTLSDLLGRQKVVQDALDQVKRLLEVTYPLGNEIYRDENGSAFVVPALDGDDRHGTKLLGLVETLIRDAFRQSGLEGEIVPVLSVSEPSREAGKLHELLQRPVPPTAAFVDAMQCWWHEEPADVCTACGVRPQGWGAPTPRLRRKAQQRNVCHVCLERRGERAKEWAQARHGATEEEQKAWQRTIWIDEVADENGRLALLVGRFDLDQWLNGEMVQTMLVSHHPSQNSYVSKNPSFARIQRVWRTTQQFWQNVQDADIPTIARLQHYRLAIGVSNANTLQRELGKYHVYEAEIDQRRLSVVWDSESGHLLTADSLEIWTHTQEGARTLLERLPAEIPLFEPGGYGQRRYAVATAHVDRNKCEVIELPYSPIIALLTEPRTFMALVPAVVALDVATKIAERYELEMSKVRNRLPLFLGLVFFDRRQPLFSALDAGRRLLKQPLPTIECTVQSNQSRTRNDVPLHLGHPHFEEWQELSFKAATDPNDRFTWCVSTRMGDGDTFDEWYPYYQVVSDSNGGTPSGRGLHFKLVTIKPDRTEAGMVETIAGSEPDPTNAESVQHWVHVKKLTGGDRVLITPARFAYLYLDTSARRFEAGQTGTWVLEQLGEMIQLWAKFKDLAHDRKITDTKLRAIEALFKAKWEEWKLDKRPADDAPQPEKADYQERLQTFVNLVKTTLGQEGLSEHIRPEEVLNGLFAATLELYVRIIKDRLAPDDAS